MKRRAASALLTMSVCFLSLPLAAQSVSSRDPNPALWQSTPDAAALGPGARGFLSYGLDNRDGDWLVSGGLALFAGMLHATYGQGSLVGSAVHEFALGYGRRLQDWSLGPWLSWGAGVDLSAAAQRSRFLPYQSQAVRLMVPFSLRLGSPCNFSITPYVGPYAEFGSAHLLLTPSNTHSAGLAFGGEITAWRLGLTLGAVGVPDGMRAFRPGWQASAAIRIRF
jgi:hypothetical protein